MTTYGLEARDTLLFAGTRGSGGIFISSDTGKSWDSLNYGIQYDVYALGMKDTILLAGTYDGGVFRSVSNGSFWEAINSGLKETYVHGFCAKGDNLFCGTDIGVYLSNNNGGSWSSVNSIGDVWGFAVKNNYIFTGTTGGEGIFISTNNGLSWSSASNGFLYASNLRPGALSFAVMDSTVFVGTMYNGVFRSTNNGGLWTAVNNGIPSNSRVTSFVTYGDTLFAGTFTGVYFSKDNAISWNEFNTGLGNSIVNTLMVNNGYLFAGTGNHIWRRPLSDFTGVNNPKRQSKMISQENLRVSSSSRTNSSVIIAFSLSRFERVTVKIYNLSGNEIETLVDKNLESGSHHLPWDTRNIPAGCYTVKMQVGEKSFVKSVPVFR